MTVVVIVRGLRKKEALEATVNHVKNVLAGGRGEKNKGNKLRMPNIREMVHPFSKISLLHPLTLLQPKKDVMSLWSNVQVTV